MCGFEEGRCREVRLAALLMDVGLLWVPQERLNSLGRMNLEEHPVAGEEILSGLPGLEGVEGRGSAVTKDPLFRGRS